MTLTEAAALLGLAPSTLRAQVANGRLKARKVGRDWHVTLREVERYQRENRRTIVEPATCPRCGRAANGHEHRWPGERASTTR